MARGNMYLGSSVQAEAPVHVASIAVSQGDGNDRTTQGGGLIITPYHSTHASPFTRTVGAHTRHDMAWEPGNSHNAAKVSPTLPLPPHTVPVEHHDEVAGGDDQGGRGVDASVDPGGAATSTVVPGAVLNAAARVALGRAVDTHKHP